MAEVVTKQHRHFHFRRHLRRPPPPFRRRPPPLPLPHHQIRLVESSNSIEESFDFSFNNILST